MVPFCPWHIENVIAAKAKSAGQTGNSWHGQKTCASGHAKTRSWPASVFTDNKRPSGVSLNEQNCRSPTEITMTRGDVRKASPTTNLVRSKGIIVHMKRLDARIKTEELIVFRWL